MIDKYENIDLGLEKLVFLCNAEENNSGIYELIWELGYYDLIIEDKYKIAHELLNEMLSEDLVDLNKHTNCSTQDKSEKIPFNEIQKFLNNPYFWYPANEFLSITLTVKGNKYLDENIPKFGEKFNTRFQVKKK